MPIHKNVRRVNEYCANHPAIKLKYGDGEVPYAKKIDVPGKEIYSCRASPIIFDHKGKAYAICKQERSEKMKRGCLVDISDLDLGDLDKFALEWDPTVELLEEGRVLSKEETRAIWEESGFAPHHVIRVLGGALSGTHPKIMKETLKNAGVELPKEKMQEELLKAKVFWDEEVNDIVEKMYQE